jgi:hypothetical protein
VVCIEEMKFDENDHILPVTLTFKGVEAFSLSND